MCGISGFLKYSKDLSSKDLDRYGLDMSSTLYKRGPDSFGVWSSKDSCVSLSHRRLSILDLSKNGNQPMTSQNKRFKIVYNGEIYNFLELRREIEKRRLLKTACDTEVILESISLWGLNKALKKLNGMFAFALWDLKDKKLFLARDRMGIKPIYWYSDKYTFAFSSELKAIRALPWIRFEIDKESLASYVRLNYIPTPYSIYKNIYKLKPGTLLELDQNRNIETRDFWSLTKIVLNSKSHIIDSQDRTVEETLEMSVKNQMIADVPLGVFLSGGIDSSLVACLAQKNSLSKVNTFTIGFHESSFDEGKFAKKISQQIGTQHNEEYFSISILEKLVENIGEVYDEPFADSSQLPTLLLSEITRRKVTVALSGDGGDELYGGYYRYFMAEKYKKFILNQPLILKEFIFKLINFMPIDFWNFLGTLMPNKYGGKKFGDKLIKLSHTLKDSGFSSFYKRLVSNVNDISHYVLFEKEKESVIWDSEIERLFPNNVERMQLIDSLTYLPDDILTKVDRASMNSSLEVRVPFLDNTVVEQAWKIPQEKKINNGNGKVILKNILGRYLPRNLFERPKMGFGIPLDEILRTHLKSKVENYLFSKQIQDQNLFHVDKYQLRWKEHLSGKRNWQFLIWNFLVFQIWYERWMK